MDLLLKKSQAVLFDLLSVNKKMQAEHFNQLCNIQWSQFTHMASQHRLEPILHYQIKTRGFQKYIPQEILSKLEVSYRQAAIHSLNLQRLIYNLTDILDTADITYLLTKGAWLAWNVYPHPALRPMRDIDILVRHEHAQNVFELLQANGYIQTDCFNVPFSILLKHNKHLPGLKCPKTLNTVEVHIRLLTENTKTPCPPEFSDFDKLYRRKQITECGKKHLTYLSNTDTLLHIIVHAVDEHMFNNGPAVITDVLYILKLGSIDWKHFWDIVEKGNWTKSVQLILNIVEYYNGDQNIDWQNCNRVETPLAIIQSVVALSLQDVNARTNFTIAVALAREKGVFNTCIRFFQKLIPTRYTLANIGNVSAHNPLVIFFYPIWVLTRVRSFYRGKPKELSISDIVQPVVGWLS